MIMHGAMQKEYVSQKELTTYSQKPTLKGKFWVL